MEPTNQERTNQESPERTIQKRTIADIFYIGQNRFSVSIKGEEIREVTGLADTIDYVESKEWHYRFTSFPRSFRRQIQRRAGFLIRVGVVYSPSKRKRTEN